MYDVKHLLPLLLLAATTLAASPASPPDAALAGQSAAPAAAAGPLDDEGPEPGEYLVTAGAVDPALNGNRERPTTSSRTDRFDYLSFYPEDLRIHRGDTVFFRRDGFHTVTFAPSEDDVPWFFRRDEIEGVSALQGIHPTDPTCANGGNDQPRAPIETACTLDDPDAIVTSGWRSMKLTIDLPEGAYTYFCNVHAGMEGTIEVVPDTEPVPTPEEVFAAANEQLAQDTAEGAAVLAAGQTPEVRNDGDRRIWKVHVGGRTADGRVFIVRFMPGNLSIDPGDEVEYVVPDNRIKQAHTVSFPESAYPFRILQYLSPNCDPDELDGGAPGVPLQYQVIASVDCPLDTTFEWGIYPHMWRTPARAPGDAVPTSTSVHDSGLLVVPEETCRVSCDPWTGENLPHTHRATFPAAGDFAYKCNIHVGMTAVVRVAT